MEMMKAYTTLLTLTLPLVVLYLVGMTYMMRYLRKNHQDIWEDLGSPSLTNDTARNNYASWTFVARKQYLLVPDKRLWQICNGLRMLMYAIILLMLCMIGIAIVT
jgi:hypothetical protein